MKKYSPIWLVIWVCGILFPAAWLRQLSSGFRGVFDSIFSPAWMHVVMHAGLFAVMVWLLFVSFHWMPGRMTLVWAVGIVLGVGILQELAQFMIQGGAWAGALGDLAVDLGGGLLGFGMVYGLKRWKKRSAVYL